MTDARSDGDFSERQNTPFMVGVYLAVNAVEDAFLLVDGPDCAHMKTQYVQGNHDWLSTLVDVSGFHRVANSAAHPFRMAAGREAALRETLGRMAAYERSGVVLVCPMPMAAITAVDYDRLGVEAAGEGRTPVLHVPGRSLSGDWLSGYAMTLQTLAAGLPLDPSRRRDETVAVVGHLMDRTEGDCRANVRELRRLVEGLGLELVSVWLSGGSVAELRRAEEASLVLSLPYARRAARTLARRLGTPLAETALPVGLEGTTRWLRALGEATGRTERAEAFAEEELTRVAPMLQWVVPSVFMHRTVALVGDPHLVEGLLDYTAELGCRHGPVVVTGRKGHAPALEARADELRIAFEPTRNRMEEHLARAIHAEEVDLLVTNSFGVSFMASTTPVAELGYPSYFTHSLFERPYLGYEGALGLADRMANALRRIDLLRMHRGREPGATEPPGG